MIETTPTETGTGGPRALPGGSKLGAPHIDSIAPSSGKIDNESVFEATLYGRGFVSDGSTVQFDAATVERPVTENGGTILKFIVPTMIPAHGTVQFHRVEAGRFTVKVLTPSGTSHAVTCTVRGEDR